MKLRQRLYEIIERDQSGDIISKIYDVGMLITIIISIIPLMFVNAPSLFRYVELFAVFVFIGDYLLRWLTSDIKINKGVWSFILYPFTPMAIIDLLSILPGLNVINSGFKILRITRIFKIVRLFKVFRYSKKISIFLKVLKREKAVLLSVLAIAIFYVFITALVMFNVEPHINPVTGEETFKGFFDALYWATVTLTTVGYGDLCPVTDIGRCVSMFSSIFGVAIIALPSGVITAGYLDELRKG